MNLTYEKRGKKFRQEKLKIEKNLPRPESEKSNIEWISKKITIINNTYKQNFLPAVKLRVYATSMSSGILFF